MLSLGVKRILILLIYLNIKTQNPVAQAYLCKAYAEINLPYFFRLEYFG